MSRIALAALAALALAGCVNGTRTPACSQGQSNRCSCTGGGEGLQQCLSSGEAYGACVCSDACAAGATCVAVPALVGMDMDQAGAAVDGAGLRLPDPVDPKGFITVHQIADPPVQVLEQSPPAGTPVKPGTPLVLTVTLPPDQESLGLPNSNFLVGKLQQDTEDSAVNYYDTLDPGPFRTRATLADWKAANGFGTPADAEASAIYMTHTDLGFGRHMHMRRKGRRVAFYVDNYPTIEDTIAGTRFFATVAMEYSPGPRGRDTDPYFTQFYVFNKAGQRITDPILDDHGPKQNPAVCLVCHGGNTTDPTYASNGGNLGARFIPFDVDAEEFSTRPGYTRADQEWAFKAFNEAVAVTWQAAVAEYPPTDPPPVLELIDGWYGGPGHPSATFRSDATPAGWNVSLQARDLYHKVFAKSCQTCHSQREATRNFSTYAKFSAAKALIEQRVFEEGAMPLSQRGALNFWLSYPHQPKILADWLGTQLRSPGKPVARVSVTPGAVVTAGTTVTLDAADSQYAETFDWKQTGGGEVQLTAGTANASKVTFVTPPRGTNLNFELRVAVLGRVSAPFPISVLSRSVADAPTPASAVPASGSSATVSWTAPASDGLSGVTGYTISVSPGGATVSVGPSVTSTVIGSLQGGLTYAFSIKAVNGVGNSAAATATVLIPTAPSVPTGVSAVSTHEGGTLLVSWTPPASSGGAQLLGYTVSCSPSGSATAGPAATSVAVTGLANGIPHTCTVTASNVAGNAASAGASGTPDGPPGPPQSFLAASGGGATWNLTWTPPADNGGFAVEKYIASWTPADGNGKATFIATSVCGRASCSATVGAADGLLGGVTYSFSLAATNAIGIGVAATATPPGKPVITSPVSGASTAANQIPVTWTAAAPNGSTISGYTVRAAQTVPAGSTFTVNVSGSTTSTTVSGLNNCAQYSVTVTATSGGGSATSDPVSPVTPRQAPDTPSSLVVSKGVGVGDLNFSWTSNGHGCAPVQYTVSVSDPVFGTSTLAPVTSTSIAYNTTTPACPYGTVNCASPRQWGFRVSASSPGGTSGVSAQVLGTPKLGYIRDNVKGIWPAFSCDGCHQGSNPLHLDGTGATTPTVVNCSGLSADACNHKNIVSRSPPVIQSPVANSYLLTCPTDTTTGTGLCQPDGNTRHPGGHLFNVGSAEYNVIQQWITDGNLLQ